MLGREARDRIVVAQHVLAPPFGGSELGPIGRHARGESLDRLAHRVGIDVAHELPDELHLAPPAFVRPNRPRFDEGVDQPFGKIELHELGLVERYQRLAQVLERMHLRLAAGLGDLGLRRVARRRRFVGVSFHGGMGPAPVRTGSFAMITLTFRVLRRGGRAS
jgi:hypothetical protein